MHQSACSVYVKLSFGVVTKNDRTLQVVTISGVWIKHL